ncbi:hypothetical protein C8R43DRAFT_1244543 [Mycena crocata]|nr:hypothetical protein C8R43DRAFT_1244543 [Mycena crocata]
MTVVVSNALILVASWVNISLYMLEILLAIRYFMRPNRPLLHRVGVATIVLFDTACTIGISAQVYMIVLIFPCLDISHAAFIDSLFWPISLSILGTYTVASIEQGFLCYLFYALTRRCFITGFLVFCIFLHLGFSYASGGTIIRQHSTNGLALITTQVGAISCAVTDILIAAALGITFYKMKSASAPGQTSQSLLRRLVALSLTSGFVVAFITLLAVILLERHIPSYVLFFFIQGRAYSLTVLGNFLRGLPQKTASDHIHDATRSHRTGDNATVFHIDYQTSQDATSHNGTRRLESLNLEALHKGHPD